MTSDSMPPYQRAPSKRESFRLWRKAKRERIKQTFEGKKTWEAVKDHLATTAGMVTASIPVYGFLEMHTMGLTPMQSIYTRLSSTAAGFAGLNKVYVWGRELAYIAWDVNEKSTGMKKKVADATYQGFFNMVSYPALTLVGRIAGGTNLDMEQIARETVLFSMMGLGAGPIVGMAIDACRELYGTHYSSRVPQKVRGLPKKAKVALAVAGCAASLMGSTALYEHYTDNPPRVVLEQRVGTR